MKLNVLSPANVKVATIDLPQQFSEEVRPDLVKRAVEALQANARQPYGSDPMAGKYHSTKISRRRRDYKTSYGIGISRVPRKIMSRNGTRMNWVGAFSPGTVGGRRAHPPKATKVLTKKINIKENRKAIRSALAAVMARQLVEQRGHAVPTSYPFALDTSIEVLTRTKEVEKALDALGLRNELARIKTRIRAGKGKRRGRKYITSHGPLIVTSKDCTLLQAASNIPGVTAVTVNALNADLLAPGASCGRLTLFTQAAIERLAKEHLFMPTTLLLPTQKQIGQLKNTEKDNPR